jgi:hypothetical protein
MPAIWTAPKTWNVNDLVIALDLNKHIRDNEEYLKSRVDASFPVSAFSSISGYTHNNGTFQDVDAAVLNVNNMTTHGAPVLLGFSTLFKHSAS